MICVLAAMASFACIAGKGIVVNVNFDRLSGLEKDDRVLFENNTAGRVQSVHYNADGTYTVQVMIEEGFVSAATEYAQFQVIEDPDRHGRKGIEMRLSRKGGAPLANQLVYASHAGFHEHDDDGRHVEACRTRFLDAMIEILLSPPLGLS